MKNLGVVELAMTIVVVVIFGGSLACLIAFLPKDYPKDYPEDFPDKSGNEN